MCELQEHRIHKSKLTIFHISDRDRERQVFITPFAAVTHEKKVPAPFGEFWQQVETKSELTEN
jgi:hypothetical protein